MPQQFSAIIVTVLTISRTKQWKTQLKKWGIKKRIEGHEYKSILKMKRKRELEQPGRASEFSMRGTVVPPAKIARYEAEALKNGLITEDDTFSHIGEQS
jgi:hypothetical protein